MANKRLAGDESGMANAELHALFDAAVDAMVIADENGRILAFNASAERLFGYSASAMIGQGVEMLMPEPDRSRHDGYMRRYLQTGEPRIIGVGREVEGVRATGEVFPIALSVGEAVSGGRRRFVGIIRDLTAQRAAEQHARALEARLAHVGKFNLMGEMAAGIAHEINQPLGAIATYAQAAKRLLELGPPETGKLIDICEKMSEQAHRAGQVMQNVRRFVRRRDIRSEWLDVNQVIGEVLDLIEADAHAGGIKTTMRCASDLPKVRGDAVQLQQVLLNLTKNSVDAMREGLAKEKEIVVTTGRTPGGHVCISVSDDGPGVPKSLGENIFHPFVTTKEDGLGIGLAISRTIVQALGGSLGYAGNPDGGATFSIELPTVAEGEQE